jgi:hypothetical protein
MSLSAQRAAPHRRVMCTIAALMLIEALTLAAASALHLSGHVHGSSPFDPDHAGIAEAIIGAVLACAAITMLRVPARGRMVGLAANGFAIVGFLVGLNFTTRGGHLPDVAYHLTLLPVLIGSLVVLLRARRITE